jgi:hypothetical protein
MFFSFDRTRLAGKTVLDATFRLTETWSFSCTATQVNLYRTKTGISEGTRWPGPASVDKLGDRTVSAGRGSACSPPQAGKLVEFNDAPGESDENLTSTVKNLASGKLKQLTVMLRAADESDADGWKRFKNDASLQVKYFPSPGIPTGVGVQATNDPKSVTCRTSLATAVTVADPTPSARATVQTLVQPTGTEDKGELRAEFEVQALDKVTNTWKRMWGTTTPSSGTKTDGAAVSTPTGALSDGRDYRLHAQTSSHGLHNGKFYDPVSAASAWCYFRVDSHAPKAPQVMSLGPYTRCIANDCLARGGPGQPGEFQFDRAVGDSDIVGYRWQLSVAADDGTPVWSGVPRTVTGATWRGKDVVPPLAGTYVLSVEAKDSLRYGPPHTFQFDVDMPAGEVRRWQFGDAADPGVDSATALPGNALMSLTPRHGHLR